MEIKYQLFENENLFIQKYAGDFSLENFIGYTRYITEHIVSKSIKMVVIDFRELIFSGINDRFGDNLEKVIQFRKNINENELKNKEVTLIIWVDKPIPKAIILLFTANFSGMHYKHCSTAEEVNKILNLPKHLEPIESILKNLEHTFKNN